MVPSARIRNLTSKKDRNYLGLREIIRVAKNCGRFLSPNYPNQYILLS